jgi:NAD(P)H-hydrate epimerase
MVVDADALSALAEHPEILLETKSPVILTPHPGEFGRLIGLSPKEIQLDRVGLATEFAIKYKCFLVLKGARSIMVSPEGHLVVNSTGNPALAGGGAGDVLTGLIGGFLAQGLPPMKAINLGVCLHGWAADEWAEKYGERGLLASDLLEWIPLLLKKIV